MNASTAAATRSTRRRGPRCQHERILPGSPRCKSKERTIPRYNHKYYLDTRRGLDDEAYGEFLETLGAYGPYACIDWDEYSNSCYPIWMFSDPDFMIEGCEDQPWTLEGELYNYGNQHYIAIATTIKTLRSAAFMEDDEIFDFFVEQGSAYFGDATAGALMSRCLDHYCAGSFFKMPYESSQGTARLAWRGNAMLPDQHI